MNKDTTKEEPDWDAPLTISLTPAAILNTFFASADSVHTGWETCIEDELIVAETTVVAESSANHCRFIEQEYSDQDSGGESWHDWTVELQIGEVFLLAHWRARISASPADWEWCAAEAERAFTNAAALLGRRVRRGLVVDQPAEPARTPRTRH
jgi:hypothetical protein